MAAGELGSNECQKRTCRCLPRDLGHRRRILSSRFRGYYQRGFGHVYGFDVAELHLQHFDGLFAAGESDEEAAFVLDDVRVVDVAAADEVEHLGEDEAVVADGERERIALLRVGVGDEDVAAIAQTQAADFRGGVGEVRFHRLAPGAAVVGGEGAVEEAAAAVVAEDGGERVVRQNPPVGFLGLQLGGGAEHGEGLPVVE